MKLALRDFASMRLPMAVLVAVLVASVLLIKSSSIQHATAVAQLRSQDKALKEARERHERSGLERQAIQEYLPGYRSLQQEGLVGEEQRIEWIESLRAANKQAGLFGVAYQIEARKPFSLAGLDSVAAQYVHQTPMKLSFGVVHEGDLMRFLETLGTQKSGLFLIKRCAISRLARNDNPGPRQANLNAECDLAWLTIDPPKAGS
jgi:hypothetical protein